MEKAIDSKCSYGILHCFLPRLLLWRVIEKFDNNTSSLNKNNQLPSWSWLTQNQIKFLPKESIEVPRDVIRFGTERQLHVQIRSLQDCNTEQPKSQNILSGSKTNGWGELWFDSQSNTQVQDCVVIGMRRNDNSNDADKTFYVLLVSKIHGNQYQRVGVGMIKARHISNRYENGAIV
jgi:hypothetical protein